MVDTNTTRFTQQKRLFLLNKLDEVIKFWACGSGHGSFSFTIKNGIPSLQCGLKLNLQDVAGIDPVLPHQQHHPQHDAVHRRRHKGPARKAKDRQRAARHQAALAASAVSADDGFKPAATTGSTFPGEGKVIGFGTKPVLPIPLPKGYFFPPPTSRSLAVSTPGTTLSSGMSSPPSTSTAGASTTTMSESFSLPHSTHMAAPAMIAEESDSEDGEWNYCGKCLRKFDGRSSPVGCEYCKKIFHTRCVSGHKCLSFVM